MRRTRLLSHRGHRLEVFQDLPSCLSTMRSLILGGDFNVCLDGRDGVGEGSIDYSARALAEVMKDFSLVDTVRALHPSDAGFTWHNYRGAASRLDYIFVGRGISGRQGAAQGAAGGEGKGTYSCVQVNGFLSGAVEQAGGVWQGCPLVDPGVDGVRFPGAAGEVLKIQQYADDTTLFVSSVRSMGCIWALTNVFGPETVCCVRGRTKNLGRLVLRPQKRGSELGGPSGPSAQQTGCVVTPAAVTDGKGGGGSCQACPNESGVFRFLWCGRYEYMMYAPVAGWGCPEGTAEAGRALRQLRQ
ncbi:hypothetical protein AAFF_G00409930 [Aldrovandia affinis]|uniref:Endonuclease/exonuclease/phosphatase domain-containing protein n=1 Tax=Aldrovandia affinis TaxID=143900 RepID=A0AAD7WJU8_9TELE|nr:hypothetical protein AAFF_G00409930 [Aldrovandia affinis]